MTEQTKTYKERVEEIVESINFIEKVNKEQKERFRNKVYFLSDKERHEEWYNERLNYYKQQAKALRDEIKENGCGKEVIAYTGTKWECGERPCLCQNCQNLIKQLEEIING